MFTAIVENEDNTLVMEFPCKRYLMVDYLGSIGIRKPAHEIKCVDKEDEPIKVKIFGNSEFEKKLAFVVSFEDGKLTVEPILDDNEESNDVTVDIESENDAWYEEGYDEGHYDGYAKGYSVGYDDAENGREFNDAYPEDCGIDCDYDCENCRFYNASKDTCEASDEE